MKLDLVSNIHPVLAIAPVVATDDTVLKSGAIDVRKFNAVAFVIATGVLADTNATFAVVVKEGATSTQTAHTAVAAANLIGGNTLASFTFADDSETRKVGYKGSADYVSIEITPTGNTGNAPISVVALLTPLDFPAPNPPQ